MAIGVTKVNGDTQLVNNVGDGYTKNANAQIINTGISSPIQAYNIQIVAGNLAAELSRGIDGTAGAVETLLTAIAANATILAYQVDNNTANVQLSVIVERNSWTSDLALQTAVRALGSNIGAFTAVTASTAVVTSTGGIKLA
jgi:hypothetical protein